MRRRWAAASYRSCQLRCGPMLQHARNMRKVRPSCLPERNKPQAGRARVAVTAARSCKAGWVSRRPIELIATDAEGG